MVTGADRERFTRLWNRAATSIDPTLRMLDRTVFRDSRAWLCEQATGDVLEVAVGTGLNLPHYPANVAIVGIDLSPVMLDVARRSAIESRRDVDLRLGDAEALDLPDASFDTVVCTFALCGIPDHRQAITEMVRVLRPGGRLLLADHVAAAAAPVRGIQWLAEAMTIPLIGEHFRRRPFEEVVAQGLDVHRRERFSLGAVERLVARKPAAES